VLRDLTGVGEVSLCVYAAVDPSQDGHDGVCAWTWRVYAQWRPRRLAGKWQPWRACVYVCMRPRHSKRCLSRQCDCSSAQQATACSRAVPAVCHAPVLPADAAHQGPALGPCCCGRLALALCPLLLQV